ncbi:signal peptidase I [Nostocoides sp. F2B08]|nr:signal peptidase I [Tetrasphaera sp. F2B08]
MAAVIVVAALVVLAARQWVLTPYRVDSDSMAPTIASGSTVYVSRVALMGGELRPAELVAFDGPRGTMVKRVVGVGGDTVAIVDAVLYVNGEPQEEPYTDPRALDGVFFGPVNVPEGHVFVMGDNRFRSIDSREFGSVPLEDVTGRVVGSSD